MNTLIANETGFDQRVALCKRSSVLAQYLTDGPYRFSMHFGRGAFERFYGESEHGGEILRQRRQWLKTDPDLYLALRPEGEALLTETVELARDAGTLAPGFCPDGTPLEVARRLGEQWEPDYLLLARETDAVRLVCGCVCFPSSWSLEEKIGRRIEEIHEIVPGLNPAIGRQIQTFLEKLKPGVLWTRSNWGLSRSPELNQHPTRKLPRLDAAMELDEVFFRVEEQSLLALPKTKGVLFGIRVKVFPVASFAGSEAQAKLVQALETMPEEMAQYKGIARARTRILKLLRT